MSYVAMVLATEREMYFFLKLKSLANVTPRLHKV